MKIDGLIAAVVPLPKQVEEHGGHHNINSHPSSVVECEIQNSQRALLVN